MNRPPQFTRGEIEALLSDMALPPSTRARLEELLYAIVEQEQALAADTPPRNEDCTTVQ